MASAGTASDALSRLVATTWHPRPAYPPNGKDPDAMGVSLRTDRYRYTEWRSFGENKLLATELYDHRNDPAETSNRADDPKLAEDVKRLARKLRTLQSAQ